MSAGEDPSNEKKSSEERVNLIWRNFLLLPVIFGVMFSMVMVGFVQNEWTQHVLRKEYFPNKTTEFSGCQDSSSTNSSEQIDKQIDEKYATVQRLTAKWQMIFTLSESIPIAITQLILPSYTDTYGRKFLLILATAAMALRVIGMCLTIYFEASFWFIVATCVLVGMSGSGFSLLSAAFSMVSDVTPGQKYRTVGIVVTEGTVMTSVVLSSFFSGFFTETIGLGYFYTTVITSCIVTVALLLTLIIPETLLKEKRVESQSVIKTLKRITDFYLSSSFKGKRTVYVLLLIGFGFATINGINRGSLEILYLLGQPFCWGPSKISVFSSVRSGAQTFIGIGILKFLQKCFSNEAIGILSTLSNAASYIIEAFARDTLTIYFVPVAGIFSFLVVPMIRTLLSTMTPVEMQGAMYSNISTLEVVCTLIANLSQNAVYSVTITFMNGFVFIMLAVLSIMNMIILVAVKCVKRNSDTQEVDIEVKKTTEDKNEEKQYNGVRL